jgi:effector-binding domain-containing protein
VTQLRLALMKGEASVDDVTVSRRAEQPVAVIRSTCSMSELGQRLGEILPAVHAAVLAQGRTPTQPPFVRYLDMDMENATLDFEAGIAVDAPITDADPVYATILPGGEIASAWHVGPYQEIGATHQRLEAWIAAHGRQQDNGRWEVYWTDPGTEPDPAKWRTEVLQVLASGD